VPTYAYACTTCEHRFEVQQSFSDAALTECPECQGRLRKLFNSVGIVFKGSGFYRTDSRNGAQSESAKESSAPAKTDSGSGSSDSSGSSGSSAAASTSSGSGGSGGSESKSTSKPSTPASTGSAA
jgi:putative FmdB family regulatory protein